MTPGTIVLLKGTGSAGKTSIAKAVQEQFDAPYLHLGIDTMIGALCPLQYRFAERGGERPRPPRGRGLHLRPGRGGRLGHEVA